MKQRSPMKCWLSRQHNGLYMLTRLKPHLACVGNSWIEDLYIADGDDIGFRNMCSWGAKRIWGVELAPLQSVRVWSDGGVL